MQKDSVNRSNWHLNLVSEQKDNDSLLGRTKNISQFFKRALIFQFTNRYNTQGKSSIIKILAVAWTRDNVNDNLSAVIGTATVSLGS